MFTTLFILYPSCPPRTDCHITSTLTLPSSCQIWLTCIPTLLIKTFVLLDCRVCLNSRYPSSPCKLIIIYTLLILSTILIEICKRRRTTLVIASQYGESPLLIALSDQFRIEYRNGMWTSFRATIANLSNDSSKLVQSILLKAWNEHCRLPATSLLQQYLIDLDEKARQNRLIERAKKQANKGCQWVSSQRWLPISSK
jgi:hypothetical protein